MKSRRVTLLVAVVLAILLGSVAVSQTVKRAHWRGYGMRGGHMLGFFTHYLDLDDAQQAQVKAIMQKEKPTLQPLMQQLAQAHHQMRQLEESGTFDEAQVRALATQQSQNITELVVQKARIESEMLQVLRPDQKAKFQAFMDKREARFAKHLQQPGTATPEKQ